VESITGIISKTISTKVTSAMAFWKVWEVLC
jgi:hypothetical protein